jgi:multidrug efflux system membrane fusion protein
MTRRLIYTVGAVVLLAFAIVGFRHFRGNAANTGNENAAVPVTASLATREDVPDTITVIGTVQAIDTVSVQARVNGPITKVEFTPGQDVEAGQELFLIDPRPFQAALDEADAQLAHDEGVLAEAQVDLIRFQTLARENSIAKQQAEDQVYVVEQDKGTVQLDQANVETAQLNLEFCHVASPISGRVGVLLIDLGNLVGPSASSSTSGTTSTSSGAGGQSATGGSMVTIAQMKPIYVSFNVPQNMLEAIQKNQTAEPLEVDAYSQAGKLVGKGTLLVIDNQVNTSTGTVMMQATFANADEALWPGEFVRAKLIVTIRKNVVTVPAQAVMEGPNGSYVYVINPDETVHRVDVELTDRQGATAVIAKGLSGKENVVVDGQYRLDDGVKVEVQHTVEVNGE